MPDRVSTTWIVLVGSTLVSYAVGHRGHGNLVTGTAIILIAGMKARLVVRNFMEIRVAPPVWRRLTDAWIAACIALVVGLHFR